MYINNELASLLSSSLRFSADRQLTENFQIASLTRIGQVIFITPIQYDDTPSISQIKELGELIRAGNFALYSQAANNLHVNATTAQEIQNQAVPVTFKKVDILKQGLLSTGNQNDELNNVQVVSLDDADMRAMELAVFNLEFQMEVANKAQEKTKTEELDKKKVNGNSRLNVRSKEQTQKQKSKAASLNQNPFKIESSSRHSTQAKRRRENKEKESKFQKQSAEIKWEKYEKRQEIAKEQALDFEHSTKRIKSTLVKAELNA